MLPLGLGAAGLKTFHAALAANHGIRTRLSVLDLEGRFLTNITEYLWDGQVDVDWKSEITRQLQATFVDPDGALPLEGDSPADGALYMDRMVRAVYIVPMDGDDVEVPVFTGPVTKLDRSDDIVTLEAQGKESLAMNACWRPLVIKKGTPKTTAIRRILEERAGESEFDIPSLGVRLPRRRSLGRESIPWKAARSIGVNMDRQLFYDGRGVCRLRVPPERPGFTFRTDATVTSPVQMSYTSTNLANAVHLIGSPSRGATNPVDWTAVAPRNHVLSPWNLGRNGVPRYLLETVNDDSVRTTAEAKRVSKRALNRRLREIMEASFDAVPIPHLEPGDVLRLITEAGAMTFNLRTFTLPLKVGQSMSVGYTKPAAVHPRVRNP